LDAHGAFRLPFVRLAWNSRFSRIFWMPPAADPDSRQGLAQQSRFRYVAQDYLNHCLHEAAIAAREPSPFGADSIRRLA